MSDHSDHPYPNAVTGFNPFELMVGAAKYFIFWVIIEFWLCGGDSWNQRYDHTGPLGAKIVSVMFLLNWVVHVLLDRVWKDDGSMRQRPFPFFVRVVAVALSDVFVLSVFLGFRSDLLLLVFLLAEIKTIFLACRWVEF